MISIMEALDSDNNEVITNIPQFLKKFDFYEIVYKNIQLHWRNV